MKRLKLRTFSGDKRSFSVQVGKEERKKNHICVSVGPSIEENHPTFLFAKKFAQTHRMPFVGDWQGWISRKNETQSTATGNFKVLVEFVGAEKEPRMWLRGIQMSEVGKRSVTNQVDSDFKDEKSSYLDKRKQFKSSPLIKSIFGNSTSSFLTKFVMALKKSS